MTGQDPIRERPKFPAGYGLPDSTEGLLDWSAVEVRLIAAEHYWLATVRPDGRPHVVPRWGVWLDSRLYYDGAPTTRHARNLSVNPACTLNLEDGKQSVILEGVSEESRADADDLGARLAESFSKYHKDGYEPTADSWAGEYGGGLRVFTPHVAMAWFHFPTDATRFRFRVEN
jgi:nitroimidazol reductase NimA-like FMN-containing flavoprotein (pyridoxamine 5'-phosphate oxidase superfamily)